MGMCFFVCSVIDFMEISRAKIFDQKRWGSGMKDFLVRRGCENDRQALQELLASYQMETDINPVEFWVAEVNDTLVGAVRLEQENQTAYLRPIAVDQKWQAQGIGRALMQEIMVGLPNLNVVARGEAAGFYRQ